MTNNSKSTGTTSTTNLVDTYLEQALSKAGGSSLSADLRAALKHELLQEMERRLRLASLEALGERGLQDYAEFLQQGQVDTLSQVEFFQSRVPEYQKFLERTLQEVVDEFIKRSQA